MITPVWGRNLRRTPASSHHPRLPPGLLSRLPYHVQDDVLSPSKKRPWQMWLNWLGSELIKRDVNQVRLTQSPRHLKTATPQSRDREAHSVRWVQSPCRLSRWKLEECSLQDFPHPTHQPSDRKATRFRSYSHEDRRSTMPQQTFQVRYHLTKTLALALGDLHREPSRAKPALTYRTHAHKWVLRNVWQSVSAWKTSMPPHA